MADINTTWWSTDYYNTLVLPTTAGNISNLSVWERHTPAHFLATHLPVVLAVDRYITPIWYVIGIVGNLLSARVWLEKRMRSNNSSAIYLATLSITDMLFLLLHIFQELKYAWDVDRLNYPVVCESYFLFYLVAQYLSPMLVLGFTVERWIAVCHPFKKEKYCTTSRASKVVVLLGAISILLCSMQAYFWFYNHESGTCEVRKEAMEGGDASIWSIWTWITEMLIFLIVPVVILIFNVLVIREVRRMSQNGQAFLPGQVKGANQASRATTVMLLCVSFYVIFTTLPATLVYVLVEEFPSGNANISDAMLQQDPQWQKYLHYMTARKIVEEICLSHYACNFFLYLITGVHFRKALIALMRCKMYASTKSNGKYCEISQRTTWQHSHITKV